jgi:hypothetical protein
MAGTLHPSKGYQSDPSRQGTHYAHGAQRELMTKSRSKTLFSRSEVARLFHVSPITVTRWAEQGKLPYQLTLGGQRRYPREGTMAILGDIARRAQAIKGRTRPSRDARTRART